MEEEGAPGAAPAALRPADSSTSMMPTEGSPAAAVLLLPSVDGTERAAGLITIPPPSIFLRSFALRHPLTSMQTSSASAPAAMSSS